MIFNNKKLLNDNSIGINADKINGDNLADVLKKSSGPSKTTKKQSQKGSGSDFQQLSIRLMLIVAAVVFVLALVNALTADIITEREIAAGIVARQSLIPAATAFNKIEELNLTADEAKTVDSVYEGSDSETLYGYCVDISPAGFGGDITMIVAVSADLAVLGVKTITSSETPGIGANVVAENSELLSQFKDLPSLSLGSVSAISGATVTSTAVLTGIKTAVAVVEKLIGGAQ